LAFFSGVHVVVLGGGDLASGVIYRLRKAGFPIIVTELPEPLFVRRTVCYGDAAYSGKITVEGVTARLAADTDRVRVVLGYGEIPVLIDPSGASLNVLAPTVIVDARMEKRNLGITRADAPLVIALGPGFAAGDDVHAVIETNRGHDLGRVIWDGSAEPDTGQPGNMKGKTHSRVLRSPANGHVIPSAKIGDTISAGDTIATVNNKPIVAQFDGVLRGLIHERVQVRENFKIGDLDPRGDVSACYKISDKSLAVGGGVVEAVLSSDIIRAAMSKYYETAPRL
jgi:xanthine dehydrogenase accessory factor